jgi:hypothetical protein
MFIYWAILLLPIFAILHPVRLDSDAHKLVFKLAGVIFIILIGLRYNVGGDWDRYISIYEYHKNTPLDFSKFSSGDYAYELIHWVSLNYLYGIYTTNLICAVIFITGLFKFCQTMPSPWLALLISINFLLIVVAMGYTRQAAAVGFLFLGLVSLMEEKKMRFYVYIIVGALFHKTLLIMFPIGYLYINSKNEFNILHFIAFSFILLVAFKLLLLQRIEHLYYYYIEIKFHDSGGALIRVFMNFISALIFFKFRKKFKGVFHDERLWFIFSMISIVMLPAAYFYSTLIDRIAIFFIPLQLAVLSRVPLLIASKQNRSIFILGVIIVYSSALFVWLNYGNHSNNWIPYQNILTL